MGEKFGSYDLLEKIAVGGMAEIFKARAIHGRGVEKVVCIKRIHPALSADKDFVGMFIDEARLGVNMVHGNIVPVFDFGCIDGRYYLALEFVEGQDLAALHGRARVVDIDWPPELAMYVVAEVLEGLVYAHRKRDDQGRQLELVHRDVSPSNILLSRDGQVKLLDFGIARSAVREFETRTGVIKGKPGYMSPEQAAGATVDSRADVWSCGAVLHELLTGARLRDGRARAADGELDALLDRALAARLEDRYADAGVMQQALHDLLSRRGSRPRAADLAAFTERVESARAPGEDWDMRSTGVEDRLAALEQRDEREPSAGRTDEVAEAEVDDSPATAGGGPTRQVTVAPGPAAERRPRRAPIAFAVAALAAVGLGLFWALGDPERAPALADDGDGADATGATRDAGGEVYFTAPPEPEPEPLVAREPEGDAGAEAAEERPPAPDRERQRPPPAAPPRKATLNVVTQPWSTVTLNGRRIGDTPIRDLSLPPGRYRLELTNPVKNLSRELTVVLKPGENRLVSERLE